MTLFSRLSAVVCLVVAVGASAAPVREVVGVAHIGPRYTFKTWPVPAGDAAKRDILNEGADELVTLGTQVIKIALHPNGKAFYWYTENPGFTYGFNVPELRLKETARLVQYDTLFRKPFKTYIIATMANLPIMQGATENIQEFGKYGPLLDGLSTQERAIERAAMKNLAVHLFETYAGTGKTFVLQNGETDHILREGLPFGATVPAVRIQAVRDWINARQDGVNDARALFPSSNVRIVHATEVNAVADAINGVQGTATNEVVPYTYCNQILDAYSAWSNDAMPSASMMYGFWLIRPDGVKTPTYYYLQSLLPQGVIHVSLKTPTNYYVSADDAGGGSVHVNAPWSQAWEYLTILDRNGSTLRTADPINILTKNGHYLMAWNDGGGAVDATSTHALAWETFTITRPGVIGAINNGNTIAIRTGSGHYFGATGGGGGSSLLAANSTTVGSAEQFVFLVQP